MFVRTSEHVPAKGAAGPHGQRGFQVSARDEGHVLELWGPLDPGWADPLCRGLARAGLSIRRGQALRLASGAVETWDARFDLERAAQSTDPVMLDYLALLARGRARSGAPIQLKDYALEESSDHGGCLRVEVRGPDRVGFLGGFLERLSFLGLSPVEMKIETHRDGVDDCFLVQTSRGDAPPPRARKLLAEVLDGRLLR